MGASRRGFSRMDLIGLLTIGVLMLCVVVPAVRAARQQSNTDKQLSHAKEWVRGWASYSSDHGGAVVMAMPSWHWVHYNGFSLQSKPPRTFAPNPIAPGSVFASGSKTYTLHMLPWINGGLSNVQIDSPTMMDFDSRPSGGVSYQASVTETITAYSQEARLASLAWHPSLGYNGVFVGGSYRHRAYGDGNSTNQPYVGNNPETGGHFYVRRVAQITNPRMTIFSPARGGDVSTSSQFWSHGAFYPNSGVVRPGYWLITPPRGSESLRTESWLAQSDPDGSRFNPARVPGSYGNLDFRIGSTVKTFVATADGAVPIVSIDELRDMRRWAAQATSANWTWTFGQNP